MNAFRTTFPITKAESFGHHDFVMLCGSCFVENMGEELENYCFNVMTNPAGILFNPVSLAMSLEDIIRNRHYKKSDLIFYNKMYHSFLHHSRFSCSNVDACLQQINAATEKANHFLSISNYLFITLGTAWVYVHKPDGFVVSSCHKIPQQQFSKKMLSIEESISSLSTLYSKLHRFNKNLKIILTVSPVRHIKDGFPENQHSKAVLLLTIQELCKRHKECAYFPAYELLMDDLRDYRFYADDMLHPSQIAVEYIWERFEETFFNEETRAIIQKINALNAAARHRPFHPELETHKRFLSDILLHIEQLQKQYPSINFSKIAEKFNKHYLE